jgi:uncharacterized protein (DUF488 family)
VEYRSGVADHVRAQRCHRRFPCFYILLKGLEWLIMPEHCIMMNKCCSDFLGGCIVQCNSRVLCEVYRQMESLRQTDWKKPGFEFYIQ